MNKNNVAIALFDNVTAVSVVFPNSNGVYTYMTMEELQVGDKVLVDTPRAGLVVVTVKEVDVSWDIDSKFSYKFIVDKVNMEKYERINQVVEEVRETIEAERKAQARKAVIEQLGLKANTVKRIAALTKL